MIIEGTQIPDSENDSLRKIVQARLDNLTKPPGSLGLLEEIVIRYCLARNSAEADIIKKKCYIFAADHGITAERVSPYPREVTSQMVINMLKGGAAVTVMCRKANIEYYVVDMGVDYNFEPHPFLISRSIEKGTCNFRYEPAMTEKKCKDAVRAGYELGINAGVDICVIGEMGIGNTASASAIYSLLLNVPAAQTTGRGTAPDDKIIEHKINVINESINFHIKEWDKTPFDALRRVGGYEIAGMVGFIIGCSSRRIPVVIDGFISTAAALCAVMMYPLISGYLFFGHASNERFHKKALEIMKVRPILELDMRLGEGTGAVLALNVIEQALNCYHNMATFSSAGVSGGVV